MKSNLKKAFEKVSELPEEQQEAIANSLLRMDYWDKEKAPMFKLNLKKNSTIWE